MKKRVTCKSWEQFEIKTKNIIISNHYMITSFISKQPTNPFLGVSYNMFMLVEKLVCASTSVISNWSHCQPEH